MSVIWVYKYTHWQ